MEKIIKNYVYFDGCNWFNYDIVKQVWNETNEKGNHYIYKVMNCELINIINIYENRLR